MSDTEEEATIFDTASPTEDELSKQFRADLTRLGDRCVFRAEVRMLCWTHAHRREADTLRIDYVVNLEGRLLGVEIKRPPAKPADLGRYCFQAAQYAMGVIAPHVDTPREWVGRPLEAVFVRTKTTGAHDRLNSHFECAPRLFGPANVGFVVRERRGLCLRLCAERFWTEWSGYHQGMLNKANRVGNGSFQAGMADE